MAVGAAAEALSLLPCLRSQLGVNLGIVLLGFITMGHHFL